MNKIIYKNFLIVMMIFSLFTGIIFDKYVIANTNAIYVVGPQTVEEGGTITFNVKFGSNVEKIWLSDGDIIKKGFKGNVTVKKLSEKSYNVTISNVSSVGIGKFIVVNSGVGIINNSLTDECSSNVFEITKKAPIDQNTNNSPNDNENTKPNTPSNDSLNNKPNTPPSDNTNTKPNTPSSDSINTKPNTPSSDSINTKPNTPPSDNANKKPSTTPSGSINNNQKPATNIVNKPVTNVTNNNQDVGKIETNPEESKEEIKQEKVLREIPNTGKIF